MVAPICSTICGPPSAAAVAAAVAEATGCCPVRCATVFTEGDELVTVPEFDIPVADGQLVEATVTGYVVRTDVNINGVQGGFVDDSVIARRYDADNVFPGLAILMQTFASALSLGLATTFIAEDATKTLRFQLDGASGTYRWDLEMHYCVKDQLVDVEGGG